jgi:hypothetical protein
MAWTKLRSRTSSLIMVATTCVALEGVAHACSFGGPQILELVEDDSDTQPPAAIASADASWKSLEEPGCGVDSSCDDVSVIRLDIVAGQGEMPAGFLLELVDGALPPGVVLPSDPVVTHDGTIWLHYTDDPDDPARFSASIRITPVDRVGNVGPTTDPIHVSNRNEGCRIGAGRRHGLAWALLGVALLALQRRRRATVA